MVDTRPISLDEVGAWWRQYAWSLYKSSEPSHYHACIAADSMMTFTLVNGLKFSECGLHLKAY